MRGAGSLADAPYVLIAGVAISLPTASFSPVAIDLDDRHPEVQAVAIVWPVSSSVFIPETMKGIPPVYSLALLLDGSRS